MTDPIGRFNTIIPGLDTPEGAARFQREIEARNDVDFSAFQMLRRLVDEGLLNHAALKRAFIEGGETKAHAAEFADEIMDEVEEIIRNRQLADHRVLAAAAGKPE